MAEELESNSMGPLTKAKLVYVLHYDLAVSLIHSVMFIVKKMRMMIKIRANPLITFIVPITTLSTEHLLTHLITPNNPTKKVLLLAHFTDEETGITKLSGKIKIQTQASESILLTSTQYCLSGMNNPSGKKNVK